MFYLMFKSCIRIYLRLENNLIGKKVICATFEVRSTNNFNLLENFRTTNHKYTFDKFHIYFIIFFSTLFFQFPDTYKKEQQGTVSVSVL